jgi:hypothetical protein
MNQKLQREYGLTGARAACEKRCTAAWQTSTGDFVESSDAGRNFASYWRQR